MSGGGIRVGAGRPKGAKDLQPRVRRSREEMSAGPRQEIIPPPDLRPMEIPVGWVSPLEYMLSVVNDPSVDALRRDRMAQAAAPYCHAKKAEITAGSKKQTEELAKTAGDGTSWADDLRPENVN